MGSEFWGWILLGIAIGYFLNDYHHIKTKKNSDDKCYRPPLAGLTIPVTRLKPTTSTNEAPHDPMTNTSTVDKNSICDIHFYLEEYQIALGEILTLTSTPSGITYTNNQLNTGSDVQLYEVSIRSVNSDSQNKATFKIDVI
jgi:hypothetical protein